MDFVDFRRIKKIANLIMFHCGAGCNLLGVEMVSQNAYLKRAAVVVIEIASRSSIAVGKASIESLKRKRHSRLCV